MKKNHLYMALGTLALTACTSTDVIEDNSIQGNAIGFENVIDKQTRIGTAVDEMTNSNFDQFQVYGYYTSEKDITNPIQVFSGEPVTKNGNTWGYVNTRYWVPKATYHFFAYSCSDVALNNTFGTVGLDLNATGDNRQLILSGYKCDATHNHDLIYAQSRGHIGIEPTTTNAKPNKNVSFNFNHILTKIDAQFTSEFDGDYEVEIRDVRIINFRNMGNYRESDKWTNVEREKDNLEIKLEFDDKDGGDGIGTARAKKGNSDALTPQTHARFMIPYNYVNHDVQLKFDIKVYKGKGRNENTDLVLARTMTGTWSPNWELGKYYTYNIRLTGTTANLQPIVFETAADMNLGWVNGTSTATEISFSAN